MQTQADNESGTAEMPTKPEPDIHHQPQPPARSTTELIRGMIPSDNKYVLAQQKRPDIHHQPQPPARSTTELIRGMIPSDNKYVLAQQKSNLLAQNRERFLMEPKKGYGRTADDYDNECGAKSMVAEPASEPTEFKYCVGYWWSDKKSQKLNANKLAALFAERQCKFVKLDFDKHLDQQGPFDVIVHKMGDILVKADQGDSMAKKTISAFESYVRKHPRTIILDPLDNNRALMDRYKQYRLIEQSDLARENVVFTPTFVHLTSTNIDVNRGRIRRSKITFPIVCKPILAQGSTGAHQMCIIFNEAGLKDIKPPCVAQSFVNHNAKLFKVFVIKDKYYVMERPSLKNFQAGDRDTVFFFSHDISKPNSSSSLTELDEADKLQLSKLMAKWDNGLKITAPKQSVLDDVSSFCYSQQSPLMPSRDILSKIVRIFSEKLGLTFYGIDIIIENGSNRYAIIDMNTFPGYDGVESFLTMFRDVVCDAIPKNSTVDPQTQLTAKLNKRKPTEHDSGIEST